MPRCYLALGGNLGPVETTFEQALSQLDQQNEMTLLSTSSVHRTEPVGEDAGNAFLNAAAAIETELPPRDLLNRLQTIEQTFGRTGKAAWKPRRLDLDLLLYGGEILDEPDLQIPHSACWYRRFVLDPWVEIAAEVIHPVKGISVGRLRDRLLARPFRVAFAGHSPPFRRRLSQTLQGEFPGVEFFDWNDRAGETEPTLLIFLGPEEAAGSIVAFQDLPRIPRLDASQVPDAERFVGHVLQSARAS